MIVGTVRVDLSGYVTDGRLMIGRRELYALYQAVGTADRRLTVEVDIGSAQVVDALVWAVDTLREVFLGCLRVEVVGDHAGGVVAACRVFGTFATEAAA